MTLMQCKNCGKGNSENNNTCDQCGAILPQSSDLSAANAKNKASDYNLFVPLGVITFFVMIGVAIMSPQNTKATNNVPENKIAYEQSVLDKVHELTRPYNYRTLEGKIEGYKKAISELETLTTLNPEYKSTHVKALQSKIKTDYDVFVSEKRTADELKQKQIAEKERQLEADRKAVEEQNKINEARRKKLISGFNEEKDEVENIAFYTHKSFPKYVNSRSGIFPYVSKSKSYQFLRIKLQYTADDWLFIEQVVISTDGERFVKNFDHWDWKRDNGAGQIWEWIDLSSDDELRNVVEKIANSKTAIIRFIGQQYRKDIVVSAKDKKAIKDTLELLSL